MKLGERIFLAPQGISSRFAALWVVAGIAGLGCAVPASAGTASGQMDVSLTVEEHCRVEAQPLRFAMTTADTRNATGQSTIDLDCTPGAAVEIAIDHGRNERAGQRRMVDQASGASMAYDVYSDPARTARWDDGRTGTVSRLTGDTGRATIHAYGQVERAAGEDLQAGEYRDTLVVSVHF